MSKISLKVTRLEEDPQDQLINFDLNKSPIPDSCQEASDYH